MKAGRAEDLFSTFTIFYERDDVVLGSASVRALDAIDAETETSELSRRLRVGLFDENVRLHVVRPDG